MELRHLRYLIAVAETGSLTEAAGKRLHTSQPSLSRQIRDLEDQVGVELLRRSARGVELTEAGTAFVAHAKIAMAQVEAAVEAARRAAQPAKPRFAMGFMTGQELTWLSDAMHLLRKDLPTIEVAVSSDYSPVLAASVARGKLDLAFMRVEPAYDLEYRVIGQEPLVVLMPSDHPLTARKAVRPKELEREPFIAMADKANVLRQVVDNYLARSGVTVTIAQAVDNPAMVMSLIASLRGVALIPAYVRNLMPRSVVSRPLAGNVPTIELAIGYSKSNASPVLASFLSQLDELIARIEGA
jgi:LysR family hca operon transcriptional activator